MTTVTIPRSRHISTEKRLMAMPCIMSTASSSGGTAPPAICDRTGTDAQAAAASATDHLTSLPKLVASSLPLAKSEVCQDFGHYAAR